MARDLNEAWGWIERIVSRVSRLESGAMLENSSITNGRMRFIGGLLRIDSGGRVEVDGELSGIGKFLWDGIVTLTSALTSTGIFNQNGPWNLAGTGGITGDVSSTGAWTQSGTYTVTAGGKIVVAGAQSIVLSSAGGTATLQFSDGPRVWSNGAAARMDAGPGKGIVLATDTAGILRSPNTVNAVATSDLGTLVTGPLTASSQNVNLTNLPLKAGAVNNLHVDSNGRVWKTS